MEAEGAPLKSAYDIADESALPIDIPCAKLLSWLVDRQQLPPDWPKRLRAVRSKLDACLAATPDVPEVIELLSGTYIDYHTSTRVLAALKGDSTTGAKSWFGQHTDAHTIAWQGIVEGYASQNVYLGEYAQLLMQAASFDLPNMKKRLGIPTPPSPLFLGRFSPVLRRFSAVILCCLASWRRDGENGRKMAENGRNLGEKRARNSGG